MAKKRISILDKKDDFLERDKKDELSGELFDINTSKGLVNIDIDRIIPSPNQPRKTFHEQTISELAESIKEHGILSPIMVRPNGSQYEIIAGERRFKAAGQAGLKEIPAIIKQVSDGDAWIISLIENIQREDLNDIDRASALRELKAKLDLPWEKLAQKLSLTKQRVLDLVGLLDLPEEIQDDIRQKKLTERHGRALRQLLNKAEVLREVFNFIKDKKLTGEQTQELVREINGKPRFTIDELIQKWTPHKQKEKAVKEPIDSALTESLRLIKIFEKLELKRILPEKKKVLRSNLIQIKEKIDSILKEI